LRLNAFWLDVLLAHPDVVGVNLRSNKDLHQQNNRESDATSQSCTTVVLTRLDMGTFIQLLWPYEG
jgi:hypothetical protein